jgi:hypothetical protein
MKVALQRAKIDPGEAIGNAGGRENGDGHQYQRSISASPDSGS